MSDFVHLHVHSMGSILDGLPTADEVVSRANELGHEAIAITDHGSMAIALQFYEAAKRENIKPIIGMEGYLTHDRTVKEKGTPIFHIGLLATNYDGYRNLCALSNIGWNEGFYNRPRFDWDTLQEHSDGLIVLSGCMDGVVSQALRQGNLQNALDFNRYFMDVFRDRYFIEVQPWNPEGLNKDLLEIADEYQIPTVITADAHFCREEDILAEEVSLVLNQKDAMRRREKDEAHQRFIDSRNNFNTAMDRINFLYPDRKLSFAKINNYLMSKKNLELRMLSAGYDVPDAYKNTMRIAEMVDDYEIPTQQNYLPKFVRNIDSYSYLEDLAIDKLKEKNLKDDIYIERLKEELHVIKSLNFSDYMLIIWDAVNWAKNNGILTGPGRGSVGGSLLAYVLGITRVDPMKYGLLFWRFLNMDESGKTARVDPPDIDTDVEDIRRDDLKKYMAERWHHAASITSPSKFTAKGMVRDISRVFAVPLSEVNEVAKHFESLEEFLESEKTLKFRTSYPEIVELAKKLEGRWRFQTVHAAGMVVADRPLEDILPLESREAGSRGTKNRVRVTAFDMDDTQKLGLIKFDFLGLSGLTVINDCLRLIKHYKGEDIDLDALDPNDHDVLDEFSKGHTVGIFQVDTQSYTNLLRDMKVDSFIDLMASNALIRPGPLLTVTPSYIARKHGAEEIPKEHPLMQDITEETYGLIIYQEQLMQALVSLGGFSKSEADKVRKIIGKKRDAKEFAPFKEKWMENASPLITKTRANKLWNDFLKFAGYAFNKSHACEYSILSYQTMWLKKYHPAEFMLALMRNETDADRITSFIFEAKRLGLKVRMPDINQSEEQFSLLDYETILFGLSNVHNVGKKAAEEIVEKRKEVGEFISYEQVRDIVNKRKCNLTALESLKNVGAFRDILDTDIEYEDYYYPLLGYAISMEQEDEDIVETVSLDSRDPNVTSVIKVLTKGETRKPEWARIDVTDMTASDSFFLSSPSIDIRMGETILAVVRGSDLMGFTYLKEFKERLERGGSFTAIENYLRGEIFGEEIKLRDFGIGKIGDDKALVMPLSVRRFKTKKGKNPGSLMCVMTVTDGEVDEKIVVFPRAYASVATWIQPFEPIVMKTEVMKDGELTIPIDGIKLASRLMKEKGIE